MKVSVLMTTYNTEKYIGEAIRSLVSQDLPFEWELLIGDDGSTDKTVDIVKDWINQYPQKIKVFVHSRDEKGKVGSRAARNRAFLLERATGEYIHFMDGDDCFLGTDTLKSKVEILDNPKYADCSCCAQNLRRVKIQSQESYLDFEKGKGDWVLDIHQYWSHYYFHTDTILFRNKCKELLLRPLYRDYLNDNFITFLILQYGKVYYQDKVGAQYNLTGDGLWTGHSTVYGAFRGLQLYDLELDVRQDMNALILNKHKGDIRKIRKSYNKSLSEEVLPLTTGLDPAVFKATLLLFKTSDLSLKERVQRSLLYLKADYIYHASLIKHRFRKYVLRKKGLSKKGHL